MTEFYSIQLEVLLVLLGIGALLLHAFRPDIPARRLTGGLALAVGLMLVYSFFLQPVPGVLFHGLYRLDSLALFFKQLLLAATALVLILTGAYEPLRREGGVEFQVLTVFAAAGMLLLASVNDFIFLFVALELLTLCFYVLVSYLRREAGVLEAGVKYLVLGALSAGLTVYGIAYLFGATGHTRFDEMRTALAAGQVAWTAYRFGLLLVLLGIGFKMAVVPMQIWAPDVYQGAPTPATAFLASGSKVAGFVLLLRIFLSGLVPAEGLWLMVLVMMAAATLLYGTLGALGQRDLKRLLGYSSIAHAGYLLMGFSVYHASGLAAVIYYLAQYVFSVLAIFIVLAVVLGSGATSDRSALAGLWRRSPLLALTLFLALMSLAGIPPLSGALGKFFLLLAVVRQGGADPLYYALAGVGAACAVVAIFFYFGVLRAAWEDVPADVEQKPLTVTRPVQLALGLCSGAIILLGVWPAPLLALALKWVQGFGI